MTITELYTQLENEDFKDHETGNLFFPAYMYMYNAEKEYEINAEILYSSVTQKIDTKNE